MEAHFVHMNTKYNDISEALNHPDGLAVIGLFFDASSDGNSDISSELTPDLDQNDESISLKVNVLQLILNQGMDFDDYFTYAGSLTTPPCSEVVTWIVCRDIRKISVQQVS